MKCPLIVAGYWSSSPGLNTSKTDCLQAECAWWLEDVTLCAVKDLALETKYVQQRLGDLVDAVKVSGRKIGLK